MGVVDARTLETASEECVIICSDEPLTLGRHGKGFLADIDRVFHPMPIFVIREATLDEYFAQCREHDICPSTVIQRRFHYLVSVD